MVHKVAPIFLPSQIRYGSCCRVSQYLKWVCVNTHAVEPHLYVPILCSFPVPKFAILLSSGTAQCFSEFGLHVLLDSTFLPTPFFINIEQGCVFVRVFVHVFVRAHAH